MSVRWSRVTDSRPSMGAASPRTFTGAPVVVRHGCYDARVGPSTCARGSLQISNDYFIIGLPMLTKSWSLSLSRDPKIMSIKLSVHPNCMKKIVSDRIPCHAVKMLTDLKSKMYMIYVDSFLILTPFLPLIITNKISIYYLILFIILFSFQYLNLNFRDSL